ncbi:MAG: hypothetical protein WBM57_14180 [Woeseiaceae bacterium]
MNSDVHPLVVALVLVLTGIAIGTWVAGSGAAASIGGPSELGIGPDGHAYVQIQDKLVEHGANGQHLQTHDLGELGVDLLLGGFDFFSNGDILLRRGPDPRSFGDNVRAYRRQTNEQSIEPEADDSGLFRCNLDTKDCIRFGETGIDFKAAHGIFIDRQTDEVYISDTTRHVLRKYSPGGAVLAGPTEGFRFPNQLLIFDGKLYVADTNHHEVRVVDPGSESFGQALGRKSVTPDVATVAGQTWPSHFARVGDRWWVNNMRTDMNQGGIYLFDDNWRLVRKLDLPEGADPIALLVVGNEVWISDWYNDKVRRFSLAGEPLADLESAGLEDVLTTARAERRKFEMISYAGIALILFILAGLAVRGFAVSMSTDTAKVARNEQEFNKETSAPVLTMEPDSKALARLKAAVRVYSLMWLVLAGTIVYLIASGTRPEFGLALILPLSGLALIGVLLHWINRSNVGTAIRVDGSLATLRDYSGRESTCPVREIRYDDTAIATPDVVVFLGRPFSSIYKRKDLKEKLFPRLADAQKVSPLQMQKILIQRRHPQGVSTVLAVVGILVYALWASVS